MNTGKIVYLGIREEPQSWSGHTVRAEVLELMVMPSQTGLTVPAIKIKVLEDYEARNPLDVMVRTEEIYIALARRQNHGVVKTVEELFNLLNTEGGLECNLYREDVEIDMTHLLRGLSYNGNLSLTPPKK